jgi:membrane protein DedA with SNARE-associated domain
MNPVLALVVSVSASLVGALIDYYLAYFLGRPFVVTMIRLFRVSPTSLERAEGWFARSGQWTVFAARFVPLLRSLISLPAGLFRMSIKPFLVMTLIGCVGWSAVLIYAGYAAGNLWKSVVSSPTFVVDAFSAVMAIVCCGYIAYFAIGRTNLSTTS